MKAARWRNSGTGDEEKGWKRLSSVSLNEGSASFAAEPALASSLVLDVKSRTPWVAPEVAFARLDWAGVVQWMARAWCTVAGTKRRVTFRATNCLRRDAEQLPQRLEAARRRDGSILREFQLPNGAELAA